MKRRKFIKNTSSAALSLPILLNGMPVQAITKSALFNSMANDTDKVLVLIQLNGGNDGLNTLIPLDQYDNLANARPNVIIPENSIIPMTDTVGLHPSMSGIKSLYDDAKFGVIQSVGYPNQNRSHFRSTDIWQSASAANEYKTTGWLGSLMDDQHPDYPEGYPNDDCPDPLAITLGYLVSETCQGTSTNFSLALNDPFALSQIPTGTGSELPDSPYGWELGFLREAVDQTNAYSTTITDAANAGNTLSNLYPNNNRLAQQLKIVAQLVSGGLQTKIYVLNLGGFDTHANQVTGSDSTIGNHANLLQNLSDAVHAFQDDLKLLGLEERVLTMTFSEFGRQIRSNFSLGTDHGTAAPLMVFGKCVNSNIIGDNPEIPAAVAIQEGVPMQYDFRSVYGSILMDWFEISQSDVEDLLYADFQYIPIITGCGDVPTRELVSNGIDSNVFPNPCIDYATISFTCGNERVRLSIFNAVGKEIKVIMDQQPGAGEHQVKFEMRDFPAGNYYYRLVVGDHQRTKSFIKA